MLCLARRRDVSGKLEEKGAAGLTQSPECPGGMWEGRKERMGGRREQDGNTLQLPSFPFHSSPFA